MERPIGGALFFDMRYDKQVFLVQQEDHEMNGWLLYKDGAEWHPLRKADGRDYLAIQHARSEETMSQEFQDKLMTRLDTIDARFDNIEDQAVTESVTPPPKKRIEAFEEVKPHTGNGGALPVYGVSHEEFLAGLTGIRKGVTHES